ncbi:uncharacterized protein LOC131301135 isoform X2 [Rhododendron vialii]|uniref:uncharacterized protein LOC131301135 isoform X2 n=1 Tax=Rhododendron vialii TaxID=182163 RepID=UPI00265F186C|nr:uncharacterized protein LOC131301135 isoform X2 [Rhododendron vialii]
MSFKLLEINILSAQDLAPVSKLLRTFAVAWVHPDQKLTTRVDHHGNTNPTWNYRFVFRLDDLFLSSSSSALTIEIYNVSWLRDIPIGSVHAPIASIVPPRSQTDSNKRLVSLQIRRPSGTLQGTLNLGVNVIDSSRRSVPLDRQLSAPTVNRSPHKHSKRNHEHVDEEEEKKNAKKIRKLRRSQSDRTDEESTLSKSSSIFTPSISRFPKSKVTTAASISSYMMRPLPSEVAASMAKGLYSTSSSGDLGSSVFENWTVVDGGGGEAARPKAVRWKTDDEFTPSLPKKKNRSGGGGGLLSCFGILCGYECNIVCGAPKSKTKKKRRVSEENLDLLYYRHI